MDRPSRPREKSTFWPPCHIIPPSSSTAIAPWMIGGVFTLLWNTWRRIFIGLWSLGGGHTLLLLSLREVKRLMRQLLEGVELLHWDVKPSNILVDQSKMQLKIGDFGLSRFFDLRRATVRDSQHVCTLWYRAPKLFLGAHEYSCAIDMWSVGCIMAELLLNKVLFQGSGEVSQLASTYTVLGMQGFSSLPGSGEFLDKYKLVERPYKATIFWLPSSFI